MEKLNEKRRTVFLSSKEISILKDLFLRILVPFIGVIVISSVLLFLGLRFLLQKTGFQNYGIAPSSVLYSVSQFISIYVIIFIVNALLLLSLSGIIFYFMVHDLVFPVMRITNELKSGEVRELRVRKNDVLLIPLVKCVNNLIEANKHK